MRPTALRLARIKPVRPRRVSRPDNPPPHLAQQFLGPRRASCLSAPQERDQRRHAHPHPPPRSLLSPARLSSIAHRLTLHVCLPLRHWRGPRGTPRLCQCANPPAPHVRPPQRRYDVLPFPLPRPHPARHIPHRRVHPWPKAPRGHRHWPCGLRPRSTRDPPPTMAPVRRHHRGKRWHLGPLLPLRVRSLAPSQRAPLPTVLGPHVTELVPCTLRLSLPAMPVMPRLPARLSARGVFRCSRFRRRGIGGGGLGGLARRLLASGCEPRDPLP